MNKKASYYPVSDQLTRPAVKHLMQGSPASSTLSMARSPNTSLHKSPKVPLNLSTDIHSVQKPGVKAKIICHSPQVVLSNIANSASTRVERIPIDMPPAIYVTSEDRLVGGEHGDSKAESFNNITGSPLDLSSTAKLVHVTSESFDETPYPGSELKQSAKLKSKIGEAASRRTAKSPVRGLTKEVPASNATIEKPVKKRKKPAVKVVESRYNTSCVRKTSGRSFDKTVSQKTSKLSISSHKSRSKPPPVLKSHHHHHVDATPKTKTRNEVMVAKASTPSAGFKTFFESDMSHIAPYKQKVAEESIALTKATASHVESDDEEVTQAMLDGLYSEYLRVSYLSGAMAQAHKEKTRKALADLTLLCTENAQLQKEVGDLEAEMIIFEHQEELDNHLDAQITALGPAVNKLSLTTDKYNELAANVDATRHALPLNGVVVPDEKQLESVLKRTKEVFAELSTLTHTHLDICAEAAEISRKLDATLTEHSSTLNDVEAISKAVTSQAVKEVNLRLQLESESSSADPAI